MNITRLPPTARQEVAEFTAAYNHASTVDERTGEAAVVNPAQGDRLPFYTAIGCHLLGICPVILLSARSFSAKLTVPPFPPGLSR
jgi:hypothetical protein